MESASGPIRGALARLRSAPLWVWITILLTFGLLIFAYLQYRKSGAANANSTTGTSGGVAGSSAGLGTVPADGAGQPLWNTADTSGFVAGNVTDLAALLAYLQSQQTPNAPTTATPTPPTTTPTPPTPIIAPGTSGGVNPPSGVSGAQYFTITQNYSAANRASTTLSGIAGMYHTTVARLLQLNPQIKNPNLVYKGEKIRVQ